jgi:hypothetical protein
MISRAIEPATRGDIFRGSGNVFADLVLTLLGVIQSPESKSIQQFFGQ